MKQRVARFKYTHGWEDFEALAGIVADAGALSEFTGMPLKTAYKFVQMARADEGGCFVKMVLRLKNPFDCVKT